MRSLLLISIIVVTFIGSHAQAEEEQVEDLSLMTTPVSLCRGSGVVKQGTGFFFGATYDNKQALFLVTNYHVLTGHSPTTKSEPLGDTIKFFVHDDVKAPASVKEVTLPLYTNKGQPAFITSKNHPDADVAVVPLPIRIWSKNIKCMSELWARNDYKIRAGCQVIMICYPLNYYDTVNCLPIWKQGLLASEPRIDFLGKPVIVVDVRGFEGMSGAPVLAITYGAYEQENANTMGLGPIRKFIGVYTGMWAEAGKELLGYVWKADVVIDAVNNINWEKWIREVGDDAKPVLVAPHQE